MIHLAIKTIKLATAVLKFDWSAKVTLLPFTMQLFSILQKYMLTLCVSQFIH